MKIVYCKYLDSSFHGYTPGKGLGLFKQFEEMFDILT